MLHDTPGIAHSPGLIAEANLVSDYRLTQTTAVATSVVTIRDRNEIMCATPSAEVDLHALEAPRATEGTATMRPSPDTSDGAITRGGAELGPNNETPVECVHKHKESGKDTPAESADLDTENRRRRAESTEAGEGEPATGVGCLDSSVQV